MSAKTAETVLRVTGILNIILGSIGIVGGLLAALGGHALASRLLSHGAG